MGKEERHGMGPGLRSATVPDGPCVLHPEVHQDATDPSASGGGVAAGGAATWCGASAAYAASVWVSVAVHLSSQV